MKVTITEMTGKENFVEGKYVVIWYNEHQNEPSKPSRHVIQIKDIDALETFLVAYYENGGYEDDVELEVEINYDCYGDVSVSGGGGAYLLLTKLEIPK